MTDNFVPIAEIIAQAQDAGVDFGSGDPKIRLAYLTKLGLLPMSHRRKINGTLVGCYPQSVIKDLLEIERLKSLGNSYSQIKQHLAVNSTINQTPVETTASPIYSHPLPSHITIPTSNQSMGIAFLVIGLILGFLLARSPLYNSSTGVLSSPNASLNSSSPVAKTALPTTIDQNTYSMVRLTTGQTEDSGPIYIITTQNPNLNKLGKLMDVNLVK